MTTSKQKGKEMQIEKELAFSKQEYESRLERAREEMRRRGVDVFLSHTPENIYYVSGYRTPGYYAYQALLISLDHSPILITRLLEASNVIGFSWFDRHKTYSDAEDPIDLTANVLHNIGFDGATIGIEQECWYLTIDDTSRLKELLPKATWVDASGTIETLRAIKSPAELEYLRAAAKVASIGMSAGLETIELGATEREVAGAIYEAMIDHGGDDMGMPVFVSAGDHTMLVHHTSYSDRQFERGEVVFIELSGCVLRYSAALLRCAFIGQVDPEIEERARVCEEALNATLEVVGPGITSGEVHKAWREAVERGGYEINKRAGYSLGITFAPDWGEGYLLDLKENDPTRLSPGMVFHIPSSIRISGRQSVGISETILVTEGGHEVLTRVPREFLRK